MVVANASVSAEPIEVSRDGDHGDQHAPASSRLLKPVESLSNTTRLRYALDPCPERRSSGLPGPWDLDDQQHPTAIRIFTPDRGRRD